jgi:hypothetical protein
MALSAKFNLRSCGKFTRIDQLAFHELSVSPGAGRLDMCAARPVAAFALDPGIKLCGIR